MTATAVLALIGALRPQMTLGEAAGMIAIQAVPASIGAMIGAKLLGEGEESKRPSGGGRPIAASCS